MTNRVITGKQTQSIFIMFWLGSIVVSGINPEAKQDTWVSILLAGVLILPLMALYVRIIHLYPGLNLFDILFKVFGKIFGRILSLLIIFYAIQLGSMVMKVFSEFIDIVNMPETPELLTIVFITLFSIWSVKSGAENIGRLAKFTYLILFVSITLTFIIGLKDMKLDNLKPFMQADFKSLLSAAYTFDVLPLGEMVLLLAFFSSVSAKASASKIYVKSLISMTILYLVVTLRNVMILGVPMALMVDFPSYSSVSVISVGDFFSRVEVLTGINLILAGFIKVCVCLYAASVGLTKVLSIQNQKSTVAPCALLIATLSEMAFSNSTEMLEFIKVYRIYVIPFQIIIPLMIWIGAEIQTKLNSSKPNSPEPAAQDGDAESQTSESQGDKSEDTESKDTKNKNADSLIKEPSN